MARYRYEAIDPNNDPQAGTIDASSPAEGIELLERQGLQTLSFEEIRPLHALKRLHPARFTAVDLSDLIMLFRQLALMLRAGYPLLQGLQTAVSLTQKLALREMLVRIMRDIQNGSSFARALENRGSRLPALIPNLVAFGEASGELEIALEELAQHLERRITLRRRFVSSILYPAVVVSAAIAVGLFLAIVIIPKFKPLLADRAADLPGTTLMLIDLSEWLVQYGIYVAAFVGAAVFLILAAYRTASGKAVIDRVLLDMPLVGRSICDTEMAQMGWTMSLLMRAGITVQESLRVIAAIVGNHRLSQYFAQAGASILDGRSLSLSLHQRHIPVLVRNMIGVGERSGELERVMNELGEYYRTVSEERFQRMAAFIEPAMVLLVGGVVAFVYFAFFNALFRLTAV